MLRPEEKRLLTFTGFNQAFEEETTRSKTYKEAFQKVEDQVEQTFGIEKYSSYDSFRNSRKKKLKKMRRRGT